ncbi:MAG: DMT family transporter [Patescibacteria group bacterium]|mgnify:CR=1 FL=1
MISWFTYSLIATILFGVSTALYKLPFAKDVNRYAVGFWVLFVLEIFSLVFFFSQLTQFPGKILLWAGLWGVSFSLLILLQMFALSFVDTNTLFPITTSVSLILTVTFGVFFFSDRLYFLQVAGLLLTIIAVYLFLYRGGKLQYSRYVIGVGGVLVFLSVFNKIIQKIVADGYNIQEFQVYQYLFGILSSLIIFFVSKKEISFKKLFGRKQINLGVLIGIPSFFGTYALLLALTKGPFTLVMALHSQYVFVTAITGFFLFKEQFSSRKIFALVLSVCAILLIRLGEFL